MVGLYTKLFVDSFLPSKVTETFVITVKFPVYVLKAYRGSRDLTSFLTFRPDMDEWSIADQATMPSEKRGPVPIE